MQLQELMIQNPHRITAMLDPLTGDFPSDSPLSDKFLEKSVLERDMLAIDFGLVVIAQRPSILTDLVKHPTRGAPTKLIELRNFATSVSLSAWLAGCAELPASGTTSEAFAGLVDA
jgi:hypothetical protein